MGDHLWEGKQGGATITTLRAKRAENFLGLYLPHMPFWGYTGTAATNRGIRRAYRTALLQYLTGSARAILASI